MRILRLHILILSFLSLALSSQVSGYQGGDINIQCMGGGYYRVVFTCYYGCSAASVTPYPAYSIPLKIITACPSLPNDTLGFSAFLSSGNPTDVPNQCPGVMITCDYNPYSSAPVGTPDGMLAVQYFSDTFSVAPGCTVTATADPGNRNAISNLIQANAYNMEVSATLTAPVNGDCGYSPVFATYPNAFADVNVATNMSNQAFSLGGDSLVYQLTDPDGGGGVGIPYYIACAPNDPFGAGAGVFASAFSFDTRTGNIKVTPTAATGICQLAMMVTGYHNGVVTGTAMRDYPVTISNPSPNATPPMLTAGFSDLIVSGGTALDSSTASICPGSLLQIDLSAMDTIAYDQLSTLTDADSMLMGAAISVTHRGAIYDTTDLHISWTPRPADTGYHYFNIAFLDTACTKSSYAFIVYVLPVSSGCAGVWPGDADNNRIVDNNDLLPIGLMYDSTGTARQVQSIVWQSDAGTAWIDSLPGYTPGVNSSYADCNGDGIIDANDTTAIIQNFSLIHQKTGAHGSPWRNATPLLDAIASRDTLYGGDMLDVTFVLGTAVLPVAGFYGLAFTYNFDPSVIDTNYTSMSFGNSWIGSSDKISLHKIINQSGQIKAAVTRIDHTPISGSGIIATATFRIANTNLQGQAFYSNISFISDVTAIDEHGTPIALNEGADTTIISAYPAGINEIDPEAVYLLPNPAHDHVAISAGYTMSGIHIIDMMGQTVMDNKDIKGKSVSIDISGLNTGLYFIHITTTHGTGIAKLIVER